MFWTNKELEASIELSIDDITAADIAHKPERQRGNLSGSL